MTISNALLDELLKVYKRPDDLLGKAGLMKELKIRPEPDGENAFAGASGGGNGPDIQPSPP